MKVEYDVDTAQITYQGRYAKDLRAFYESDHKSAKWEFEEVKEAMNCQSAVCMFTSRNKIYDLRATRRKNVLYLVRSGANAE